MWRLRSMILDLMRQYKIVYFIFSPLVRYREKMFRKNSKEWQMKNEKFQKYAADGLRSFKECLNKNGLKFWLTSGTLLGAYREKRLLTHDIDIDVAMFIADLEKARQALIADGFELIHEFGVVGDGVSELAFCCKEVKIDIFFVSVKNRKFVHNIFFKEHFSDHNDDFRVIEMFLPETDFIEYDFLGDKYLIPEKTEEYLTANYGPNFMIPDKYWSYTRDIPSAVYHDLNTKQGFHVKHGNGIL